MNGEISKAVSLHSLIMGVGLLLSTGGFYESLNAAPGDSMRFYVGTYTTTMGHVDGKAEAIGIYELNTDTGDIKLTGQSPAIANSSHMCLGKDRSHLYAISEVIKYEGRDDGVLTIMAIDSATGELSVKQKVSSAGPGPAYLHLDRTGQFLLLANYYHGNVVVYPIQPNGLLGEPTTNIMHKGSSVNKARQEQAHPHAIVPSIDNEYVFVPDLGMDRIVAYKFDAKSGTLTAEPAKDAKTPPGSGPRHFVFAPDGRAAYCSLELSSELAVYSYDDGKLVEVARLSTLPEGFAGDSTNAEVRVSPDGRNVYVSNRGHDSIAIFSVGDKSDQVSFVETISSGGAIPRNFGISSDGKWIVAANQNSHNLTSYRRDANTGRLTRTKADAKCMSPALIRFVD